MLEIFRKLSFQILSQPISDYIAIVLLDMYFYDYVA